MTCRLLPAEGPRKWTNLDGENQVKTVHSLPLFEAKDAVWQFFVESVRENLHIVRISMVSAVCSNVKPGICKTLSLLVTN